MKNHIVYLIYIYIYIYTLYIYYIFIYIYIYFIIYNIMGAKVDWDFWISDLVKNPDGTDI